MSNDKIYILFDRQYDDDWGTTNILGCFRNRKDAKKEFNRLPGKLDQFNKKEKYYRDDDDYSHRYYIVEYNLE